MQQAVRTVLALAVLASASLAAQAHVSLGSDSATYTQNFNSLTTSTSSQTFINDTTLAGWSLFNASGAAIGTYAADTGGSNAGSFRSYGATGSTDRAFGAVTSGGTYFGSPASGAVAGYMALALDNSSGKVLDSLTLSFSSEQWRNGGNTSTQTAVLQYGFGSSFGAVASWTAAGSSFNLSSPVTGSTAATVDGNGAGHIGGLGGTLSDLDWASGQTLWLRWQYTNNVGNDHGLAIDDLSLQVAAAPVPEPATVLLMLGGLGVVAGLRRRNR
ncbi:PEP-CTERM sorting domain-containing protein [Paucibacter sp. R3-3]|uniref:PEP-CTERM sorting domain-containing protein n=1 Tax=Roseateles agri TaxID=3098619 RepID=A0ABU5DGJ0_9BURK|nr:PEP-CTERM sorting domain-containing protein [Paucibacter sp. R3-3]MDY0745401.1 PEP-CTERM sorting domain-containing protein [Paucibacter sp. R3-3]